MRIIDTLAPVFLLVALGIALRKWRILDDNATRAINACCYWVGLPCLLALKIGQAQASLGAAAKTTGIVLAATGVLICMALPVGKLLRLDARGLATFVHVAFRGNLAYVALPVVMFTYSGSAFGGSADALAALALGPTVVVYNVAAVVAHLLSTHRFNLRAAGRLVFMLATNPLLLGCVVGLAWNLGPHARGAALPVMLERSMQLLARFPLPMALLCVGSALASTGLRRVLPTAVAAAFLKTAAGPGVGLLLAWLSGAAPMETGVACILLAAPTAVASHVMASQLEGDCAITAGAITVSTLLSGVAYIVVLALL